MRASGAEIGRRRLPLYIPPFPPAILTFNPLPPYRIVTDCFPRWQMLLKRIIHTGKSKYQDVEIVETVPFGTMLLLDGKMQSSEADEWAYHETLVHIAMLHHPNPKTVFIMGGGEGATAREVLRHKTVEKYVPSIHTCIHAHTCTPQSSI